MKNTILKHLEVPHDGGQIPNRWINNDLKPIEADRRTWNFWTFHNFCILIHSNISVYMIGIGFPLVNRYGWGLYGSLSVLWYRILLSTDAVQAWIGSECIYVSLRAIWPSLESRIPNHMPDSTGMTTAHFVAYIIFMVLSLPVLHTMFEIVILIWAPVSMDDSGFGSTIPEPGAGGSGWKIAFGTMSTMGGAAARILNQNDYTSFPCYSILCATVGILLTAATQNRYGKPLWSLPALFSTIIDDQGSRSRVAAFFGGAALSVSQMGLNVPANALAGGPMVGSKKASYFAVMRRKIKV
ncbi:hypothetical protein BDV40DRAFT_286524 [Aspergillus tamarii]|uniref:Uncharacterized protein n=1 Tax=Aspergillus tamarii TaxID=41984 RepID=A0A5N6V282_ASPTM|nr:hypothetical protein BDV40DRAFT_286524 [Aspergillus tamarii]